MISQRAQRIVQRSHQRPAKALRRHGITKRLLRWAEPPLDRFQLKKQHAALTEYHQIGKAGMDSHASEDGLPLGPARAGLGHLIGAMVDDRALGECET